MKKIIAITFCLLMAATTFTFAGGEPFANAGEIYQSWFSDGSAYPEYVNGVWSTDGSTENLTFAIVKGCEDQAKAGILDQVADKDSVILVEGGKYTMTQLKEAQDYISSQMAQGSGTYPIWGCGIQDDINAVVCSINPENENAQSVMDQLTEKYGDMIVFETGDGVVPETTAAKEEFASEDPSAANIIAYGLIAFGVVVIAAALVILKKKKDKMKK